MIFPCFRRCLAIATIALLSGCAGNAVQPEGEATSRDLASDRVLVTVDIGPPEGITALSPSGRLAYQPPNAQELRSKQLEKARDIAAAHGLKLEEEWPIPALDVHCFVFRIAGAKRQQHEVIASMRRDPAIESVQALQFFHGESTAKREDPVTDPLAGWNEALDHRLKAIHTRTTGKSVTIAVVDAGVDVQHEDLQGSAINVIDLVDGRRDVPPETHGTAVVGLISARPDNGFGIRGYAPGADVTLMRACWESEPGNERTVCNSFTLAKALSLALESDADIVNLSISGPRDPLLERLAAELVEQGLTLVAAGNDATTFPASVPRSILAVHHAAMAGSTGAAMTLLPGNRYGLRNGASISAARVSAAAALIKELHPDMTRAGLERLLHSPHAVDSVTLAEISGLLRPPSLTGE